MQSSGSKSSPPSTRDDKPLPEGKWEAAPWLHWLAHLVSEQGMGEYIVNVHADGSVTVKRPRTPLRFEWSPTDASASR